MSAQLGNQKMNLTEHFEKIYIDQAAVGSAVAQRVRELMPADKIRIIDQPLWPERVGQMSPEQFNQSKRTLFVTPFKGQFFKRCPGATQKKVLSCCNYHVLNLGSQCNMNCSYCYLQSYLNSPVMKIYSNIDQAITELQEMADLHGELPFRIGTGEVIDSLSLDHLTLYSRELISFFRNYPKWTLEFKTKSNQIEQFLDVPHAGNVVVSWSINPPLVITREEHGTASFEQRMQAARDCLEAGFQVAFHIDPMIWHPEWKESYAFLARELATRFKPREVNVISVGALRFQPEQKAMMRERFGMKSLVTAAEVFTSEGGKLRYDLRLRQEMFQFMISQLKSYDPAWRIFLCMETPESWISSFDSHPMQVDGLRELFRPLPKSFHKEQ
jgi:spore photoproduct lyase